MGLADRYLPYYTITDRDSWKGDWELIEGIPYALASPSAEHQRVVAKLIVEISKGLNNCNCEVLPNIDYYISEDTAVKPDVLVICKEIKDKITIPPEIIFEVISPSSVKMDEHLKFELYEREKVKYYVLVYPSERKHIKIFSLIENKYQKVFETINENFSFKLENCLIDLDFSKLWN